MYEPLTVTETEVYVDSPIPHTPELEALETWGKPFGIDMSLVPCGTSVLRDVKRRRIYHAVIDHHDCPGGECITEAYVQLEAGPPPWPKIILDKVEVLPDESEESKLSSQMDVPD